MSTDACFFPCAGLGTRMGELGKLLPKPLWPFFETTLVGGQLAFAKELGFESFCINTHHQARKIDLWRSLQNEEIEAFYEETLLGSGGCFHNIKKRSKEIDNLYIFNPDSFLLMDRSDWDSFLEMARSTSQVLIAIPCNAEDSYNRLIIENNRLKEIVPPSEGAPPITYSGFGKVSLSSLDASEGASGFFKTVAIPGERGPKIFQPKKPFEFWDFGTKESYKENISKLLTGEGSLLGDFIRRSKILDSEASPLSSDSYKSSYPSVINFTGDELGEKSPGIYLKVEEEVRKVD